MGSEAVEEESKTSEAHGSPSKDPEEAAAVEEEEAVTPEGEKRGKKRESPDKEEEEGGGGGEEEGKSSSSSRRRRRSVETKTPVERPSRERKTVERYSALSPKKASATKTLSIEQGSGTKLKDIPNVVFKLSKRKVDENLQALHTILFRKKSKAYYLKKNIFQFSGFVWSESEEKQKTKVKEKLDKYTKDKLLDFCELLDVHVLKSTTKEDISAKLLEFLESPHVTRDVLLADKDKKRKKRRRTKGVSKAAPGDTSLDKEIKKHKKSPVTEVKKRQRRSAKSVEEDEDEGGSAGTKDASSEEEDNNGLEEESDHVKSEEENEKNEGEEPTVRKKGSDERQAEVELKVNEMISPVKVGSPVKSDKSPSKSGSKKAALLVEDEPEVGVDRKQGSTKEQTKNSPKAMTKEKAAVARKEDKKKSRKSATVDKEDSGPSSKSKKGDGKKGQSNEKTVLEGKMASKKKEAKPGPKISTNKLGKTNAGPSTEELHSVISNILKEVDFNIATLADILKQLGSHFNMDLMGRKGEVKRIIEDVINNMTDDDGGEDEDNTGDDEDDGKKKEEESDGDGKE